MKIAVDIDGVILDLMDEFCKVWNDRHETDYTLKDVTCYDFYRAWGLPNKETWDLFAELQANPMSLSTLDSFAPICIENINNNYDVDILTARDKEVIDILEEKLAMMGIRKNIHYNKILTTPKTPSHIKINYNYDIYIDDNPNLAEHINNKKLIIFDQPWNQNIKENLAIYRAKNWNDICMIIKNFSEN